jgi:hypothetical protein
MSEIVRERSGAYRELARSMDKVGWRRFMEGMISKEVVAIQRRAPVEGGGTLSLAKWGVGLVTKLLEVTHGQWLYRNVHVHDMSTGDLVTRRKEELRRHLEEQIALGGEGLAEEDQYLLEINLDELETTSGEEQTYWLLALRAARAAYLLRELEEDSVNAGETR